MTHKYSAQIRLIVSIILSFVIMLFINGFIGSMGGTPAFVAYTLTFYRLRTAASEKRRAYFFDYAFCYLIIWGIFRVGMFFTRITGWGNIRGLSAGEYFGEILKASMLEKWTYLFAALLMFSFILSFFPLTVIKSRVHWMCYALVDGACFSLIVSGIDAFVLRNADSTDRAKATCLVDALLIQGAVKRWQGVLFMVMMLLFIAAVGTFADIYAKKVLLGRIKEIPPLRVKMETIAAVSAGIAAVVVVTVIILLMPADTTGDYQKVAEYMTNDRTLGPIVCRGRVYVSDDGDSDLTEEDRALGYLAEKGETCESRLYRLAKANLIYSDTSGLNRSLKAESQSFGLYIPVEEAEKSDEWQEDTVFLLWDEDWEAESAYSHEPTGYTSCNRDLIEALMTQFPEVEYSVSDFYDYDAYFTIRAYSDMQAVTSQEAVAGDWVGCILAKDDKFYFGSYNNQITGICVQELREVLGGN